MVSTHDQGSAGGERAPGAGERRWTALVMAGERPEREPLAAALNAPTKALVHVCGRPMIEWVLAALLESPLIARVIVMAQNTERLRSCVAPDTGEARVRFVASGDGIASSIAAIAGSDNAPWPVLVTTADNALLTPARIATFLGQTNGADIAVGVGERRIVEREYPQSKRTWLRFSDGDFSGANLFAFTSPDALPALRKWSEIESDRKKGLKLIAGFGPYLLLRALTRSITFPDAVAYAAARLGCTARPVILDAEAPIDVDKMEDLVLAEEILSRRLAAEGAPSRAS